MSSGSIAVVIPSMRDGIWQVAGAGLHKSIARRITVLYISTKRSLLMITFSSLVSSTCGLSSFSYLQHPLMVKPEPSTENQSRVKPHGESK